MNDLNKLLSKLAAKLEEGDAKEEAEEVRELMEPETKEVKVEAECPSCGSKMTGVMIETLTDLADKLDESGAHKEADLVDGLIKKVAIEYPRDDRTKLLEALNALGLCEGHLLNTDIDSFVLKPIMDQIYTVRDSIKELVGSVDPDKLASIADYLDAQGKVAEANLIDQVIKMSADVQWQKEDSKTQQSHRYDSKHNNEQTFKQHKPVKEKETKHHNPSSQELGDKVLSTRHCPDHVGVSLHRVGEGVYRCELDGKTYNWEAGWTDSSGKHPGGSISGQTESATNVPIPSRVFDPRESITDRLSD